MSKLKVILIGSGSIAREHAKVIRNNPDCELCGIYSLHYEHAQALAQLFDVPAYADLNQLVAAVKPDLALIATVHNTHAQIALQLIKSKVHCCIEKPLDVDIQQGLKLVKAAKERNVIAAVISQSRLFEPVQRMHAAIQAGLIGKPSLGLVDALAWRGPDYYQTASWRGTWKGEGGGVLVNQAVHELDLLNYFLGRPVSVSGQWRNINHPYLEVDDSACAVAAYESGAIAAITVSNSIKPAFGSQVRISGSNGGTISVLTRGGDEPQAGMGALKFVPRNGTWTIDPAFKADLAEAKGASFDYFAPQFANTVAAIKGEAKLICSAEDALSTVKLFAGIYQSQREQRTIDLT